MTPIRFTTVENLRDEICRLPLEQYIFIKLDDRPIEIAEHAEQRLIQLAEDTDSSLLYSYFKERQDDGTLMNHPVIDYQPGSVRDDFDFGPLIMLNAADVLSATEDWQSDNSSDPDGGWYALRLRLSIGHIFAMIPEYLYTVERIDYRKSGSKQHDYVNPRQSSYQKAMEEVLTNHLTEVDALLTQRSFIHTFEEEEFPVMASVIIPVKNRVRTIGDAVRSALAQEADFDFNIIVVDNDSTDGTRELLDDINDPRLHVIHVDASEGLQIGGCWNRALLSEHCGRFAIQLDSDDIYSDKDILRRIVDKFFEGGYAMVIGSYTLVDFNGNIIEPGLIAHREWTDENGANNALRVNGFGAPRAFFTPIARQFLFPNVSYGEDYAMALRISRDYYIGRIYESLYLCRRWDGNSDADLSIEKTNAHNEYKDFIRSTELIARVRRNQSNYSQTGYPLNSMLNLADRDLHDGLDDWDDDWDDYDDDDIDPVDPGELPF